MTDPQIKSNLPYAETYDQVGFIDSLPHMAYQLDIDSNITYCNRAALNEFGYTPADIDRGLSAFDIIVSDEKDRLEELYMDVLNLGEQKIAEFTALKKNGNTFPIKLYAFSVEKDGVASGVRCIAHDITIRKEYKLKYALKIRQLNVIRTIAKTRTHDDISLDKRLQDIVDIIPSGWQYRNSACARILIDDEEHKTGNFRVTPWSQKQYFKTGDGLPDGVVEVYYLDEKPECDKGPFLLEEQYLLDDIAERLEIIMRRYAASNKLNLLGAAIDKTIEGIAIANADRRFRYVNHAFANMLGYSVHEIIGMSIKDVLSVDKRDQMKSTIAREEVERRGYTECELNYTQKDGAQIPVFLTISKVNMENDDTCEYVFVTRDISQRKRMVDLLHRSEEKQRSIFECVVEGITVTDLNGNIIEVNDSVAIMHGYADKEELLGKSAFDLILPSDHKRAMNNMQKTLINGTTSNLEYVFVKKDNTRFPAELSASVLKDSSGKAIGFVATTRDITLQKHLQENMQEIINEVIKAQEEERKRIARELHDETIQSLLSLLLDFHTCTKKGAELPDGVLEQVGQMRSKTERIIDEVRRFTHELRPAVLDKFGLVPTMELLIDQLKEDIGIDAKMEIIGVERRLKPATELVLFRVTQEALNNIRKHSHATEATVKLDFKNRRAFLTIHDNGSGFELPEIVGDLAHIGKLGVIGMYERARSLGGAFFVKSKIGMGTKIEIRVAA